MDESGGPQVHLPDRLGFGSRLIERTLQHESEGAVRLDFAPQAMVCEFDVRL
jgi:hypothetical protein